MAYQGVSVPRFYCNILEWLMETGAIDLASQGYTEQVYRTLPVNPIYVQPVYTKDLIVQGMTKNSFIALLGHIMTTYSSSWLGYHVIYDSAGNNVANYTPVVNCYLGSGGINANYDGFTIATFDNGNDPISGFATNGAMTFGSIIIGTYFDMPNAPNLSLTQSIEYGGTKEFTTYNGSSMSNTMWSKQPMWGDMGAWELGSGGANQALARSGRRSWDLKFSYMDDGDLWGPNQMLSDYFEVGTTGYDAGDTDDNLGTNIIADPGFDNTGSTSPGWTYTAGGIAVGGGVLSFDNPGQGSGPSDNLAATYTDVTYKYSFKVKTYTSGQVYLRATGGGSNHILTEPYIGYIEPSPDTVFSGTFTGLTDQTSIEFIAVGTDAEMTIDDLIIQPDNPDVFANNLLTDDNFFSQVWHKTIGGTLPFIFQPDSSNNNPDGFAICRFVDNSLKAEQTALNVYDISLKIEEVW